MATVAYTIYSHYEPPKLEELQQDAENNQNNLNDQQDTVWKNEARQTFPASFKAPPRFVAASASAVTQDEQTRPPKPLETSEDANSSAGFYRSIRSQAPAPSLSIAHAGPSSYKPSTLPSSQQSDPWFIRKVVRSAPPPVDCPPKTSSLSEILERHPPPLPDEEQFKPRVWLALGPANKGFSMLSKQGWHEGEALGPSVHRVPNIAPIAKSKGKQKATRATQRTIEVLYEHDPEVTEVRKVDVTDLTGDSEEDGSSSEDEDEIEASIPRAGLPHGTKADGRTALIVPLPIRLKSDRLGIGLKAKTVGPYNSTKTRVTPNAAALLAHVKGSEAMRRQKKIHGRGQRGFARKSKIEQTRRQDLLAYMNS